MIRYSLKAKRALAHFFSPFNDLDVFVEDTSCRNFYETLVNRILEGKAKVSRVFQLGGRDQVLAACRNDQEHDQRAKLYLIDGDFDVLLGRVAPKLSRLYRLNVYSCENLVMCVEAVHQVGYECMPNQPMLSVAELINYKGFITVIETGLLELFTIYAAAHALDREIETAAFHVFRICDASVGPPQLDEGKLRERVSDVTSRLREKFTEAQVEEKIEEIKKRITRKRFKATRVVSGKSYLLPLLRAHLNRKVRYRASENTLLVQLARHARLDIDPDLVSAVKSAAKGL